MDKNVDLALRRKVAALDGWTNIDPSISDNHLIGISPNGGGCRQDRVPEYEISLTEISLACDRQAIDFTLQTVWKPDGGYEFCAHEGKSGSHGVGSTREAALCNLFIAVMESRLAESNFSSKPQEPLIREEFVRIETPFTRSLLKQIREKAKEHLLYQEGSTWRCAYGDLEIAADKLDAMLARQELDEGVEVK